MSSARPVTPFHVYVSVALAALAVALHVLAQPPAPCWPAALLMLGPLAIFAERQGPRAIFAFSYLTSAAMALVIVRWLIHALSVEYGVSTPAAWAFAILLVAGYALVPAAVAGLYGVLRPRLAAAAAPVAFAALWTLGEWVRAEPLGLPWLLAAHPLAFVPAAIQTAALGGVWAPGFAVALIGSGLGVALARRRWAALLPAAAFVSGAALWSALAPHDSGAALRVALVQASVPQAERFLPGSAVRNTLKHVAATRRFLASDRADLVVWSETAVDDDLDADRRLAGELQSLVDETGVALVTGAPRAGGGERRNSVFRFAPGAPAAFYDKQRLVPFSEADPGGLGWLGFLVAPLSEGAPYVAGSGPVLLPIPGGVRAATPVCFEITYPELLRAFRRAGSDLVLNLSNDAWFGRTGFAETHLAHAPFRAVELRSWIVRATNTGISAVLDPRGRIVAQLGLFEEGSLVVDVRGAGRPPPYARFGDGPVLGTLGALLGLALAASRRSASAG